MLSFGSWLSPGAVDTLTLSLELGLFLTFTAKMKSSNTLPAVPITEAEFAHLSP